MSKTVILKNGTLVTQEGQQVADLKIVKGKIAEIGVIQDIEGAEIVDVTGSFLLPGLIDAHTHLDMGDDPTHTVDDFASGSRAALAGGTTTFIDFATQSKGGTLKEGLEEWKKKANGKTYSDYAFHMAIVDWSPSVRKEMASLVQKEGVSSFKMYMAYNALRVSDDIIYEALQEAALVGGLIGFHCENGDLINVLVKEALDKGHMGPYYHMATRPPQVEGEAIYRLTQIAQLAAAPIWVVHLSTQQGLEIIKDMRRQGVEIETETCHQYLVLDDSVYGAPEDTSFEGAKYVISPPLRAKENLAALWQGIAQGDVDFISSDHCPFNYKGQKDLGKEDFSKIPNGGPGIENRLGLVYTYGVKEGHITMEQLVKTCSTNPAKTFGLIGKGALEVGKDGDIVVFNPHKETLFSVDTQVQRSDYSAYEGMTVKGRVEQVYLRGQLVYNKGHFNDKPLGKFIKRSPYTGRR